LREHLAEAHPDLLRSLLETFVEALMGAEVDAICGADYRHPSPERTNRRNGYRQRPWDTRVGTIELGIGKLRQGTYFPDWLLERRRRSEVALTSVIATCYVLGVSTRRLEKLAEALGITKLSKSQIFRDGSQPRCEGEGLSHPSPGQRSVPDRLRRMPWWSMYERSAGPLAGARLWHAGSPGWYS